MFCVGYGWQTAIGSDRSLERIQCGECFRRKMMRKVFMALMLGVLSLAMATPGFSQGLYATVTGTVSDASGALIPGVEVKATNQDTGVASTTVTNETGAYNFPGLLPGKYT